MLWSRVGRLVRRGVVGVGGGGFNSWGRQGSFFWGELVCDRNIFE